MLTGTELETFPVATVPWAVWRDAHPDELVLSRDTGFDRNYGSNPYPGYDDINGEPFLFEGEVDGRFTAMTRVAGVEREADALAVPLVLFRKQGVVPVTIAVVRLVRRDRALVTLVIGVSLVLLGFFGLRGLH